MQIIVIGQLKTQGFKEYRRTADAVYLSKGPDHRIVMSNGTVKRGQPDHRKHADQ